MTSLESALSASVAAFETGRLVRKWDFATEAELHAVHAQLARAIREPWSERERDERAARLAMFEK